MLQEEKKVTKTEEKKTAAKGAKSPAVPQISVEETQEGPKVIVPQVPVLIREPSPEPGRGFGGRRGSYVEPPSPGGSRRGSVIIADEVGCHKARPGFYSKSYFKFYVYLLFLLL